MNTNYIRLFSLFKNWLKDQEYSYNTKETYLRICEKFLLYLYGFDILNIKDVDRGTLVNFLAKRGSKRYAQKCIELRQSALNVFYAWAYTNRYCQTNPMIDYRKAKIQTKAYPKKSVEKSDEITVLTPEEQRMLLNVVTNNEFTTIRNKCIISIILTTALYAEEVISLLVDDIDLEKGHVDICNKQGKERRVPITLRSCKLACQDWLEIRTNALCKRKSNLLFFTDEVGSITKRSLHRIISKSMLGAGIEKAHLGPEVLRQTAIANMLSSGKTIEEIQTITGIKTLKNIQKYNTGFLTIDAKI